ncbi:hypothetical protein ACTMTF_26935 [Nonomuraea sp. ZG12]|uniref:hypothetical protein n=1 Tax=Nonomuraea sp. ZG12 TaxID=3452207 RepID=UPI003F89F3E4
MKAVSGRLIELSVDADVDMAFKKLPNSIPNLHWRLPQDLGALLQGAGNVARLLWNDLHAEIGMAGLLIERACARYDLADTPQLGDIPLTRFAQRIPGTDGKGLLGYGGRPSKLYPNGSHVLELPEIDYGVGDMTAAKAVQDFSHSTFWLYGDVPTYFDEMAGSLVERANTLPRRAQDLRDSPWHGEAADLAQGALRQIYANVTALAATAGSLNAAARRFTEVTSWCSANFEQVVDPHRGDWDELWDFGGSADSRTRSFLAEANNEFLDVYRLLPKRIKQDLPGLLVTDQMATDLRADVERMHNVPHELAESSMAWLAAGTPLLAAYEQAEKEYG